MKPSIRFGIDIDGTVTCPTSLIPHINKRFGKNLTLDDVTQYDLTVSFGIDRTEFFEWFRAAESDIYATSPIQVHAKNVLDKWNQLHELFYITARSEDLRDVTEQWFSREQVAYDKIILTGSHNKLTAAKENKIELFMEDKHDNAVELSEELNIPVLLFNTPYNQDPVPKNVHRINSWLEADQFIENYLASYKA